MNDSDLNNTSVSHSAHFASKPAPRMSPSLAGVCPYCTIEHEKKRARQGKTRLIIAGPINGVATLQFSKNKHPHVTLRVGAAIPEVCTCNTKGDGQ